MAKNFERLSGLDHLRQARRMRKRTVVGGPAPTTSPDAFPEADHVFLGEAEGRMEEVFTDFKRFR